MPDGIVVEDQFPRLDEEVLTRIEKVLNERFGYPTMPSDFKRFLLKHNGCRLTATESDAEVGISIDVPFLEEVPVAGIFGIWLPRFKGQVPLHDDWPELFASNENSKENFDVLPDKMMSFAYEHRDSGSLFAMSVDPRDYGIVYFYYDQHLYSIFGQKRSQELSGECYYGRAMRAVLEKHGVAEKQIKRFEVYGEVSLNKIMNDPAELSDECLIELGRAMFIPVAPSFDAFMNRLQKLHR